ncbi:MAG: hypothetical protein L6277_02245 [Desulfobacterales bacterium]|nr:hypothetical protein [Pseudomonadota bacterium]MBU4354071.1 hypothetical protein [Pseudomonadota bacterium]MCG2770895.1 hypothetical protein [Desulfobacterales bacterium]
MKNNPVLEVGVEKLDMELQSRVAQWGVLKDIYLVNAKISRDPLTDSPESLSLEHKCSTELPSFDKDNNLFHISCNFQVAAFKGEDPDKLVMKIEASFCTSYSINRDKNPAVQDDSGDDLLYLFDINPIFNAWPYWREFVQNMSARMGFPALTVPLLEIAAKKTAPQEPKSQPVKKQATRRKKVNA